MKEIARQHTYFGLVLILIGMCLGIYMAVSGDHVYGGAHAHTNLIGMVLSLLYASAYRLWVPDGPASRLAKAQVWSHQLGTVIFAPSLFLLLGGHASAAVLGPILLIGAVLVLIAAAAMLVIFHRSA